MARAQGWWQQLGREAWNGVELISGDEHMTSDGPHLPLGLGAYLMLIISNLEAGKIDATRVILIHSAILRHHRRTRCPVPLLQPPGCWLADPRIIPSDLLFAPTHTTPKNVFLLNSSSDPSLLPLTLTPSPSPPSSLSTSLSSPLYDNVIPLVPQFRTPHVLCSQAPAARRGSGVIC